MIKLTFKQFRYFESLARLGHFGRAAEACAISQPALSMQIKELESALGLSLFERGSKEVRLTRFGEDFRLRASNILRAVDEVEEFAQATRADPIGRLRIGIIPTIAPYLLPRIIAPITALYRGVDLHIRETVTSKLIIELSGGSLDAAIVALPILELAFTETALFNESFVLVRPKAFADSPVPKIDALRALRLLLLEEGHCFRDQALAFCNVKNTTPRERLDGSSLSTLVQMVSSGIGVTLIPEMAIQVETRSAEVSLGRFSAPEPQRSIGMIWRKSNPMAQQFLQISDIVRCAGLTLLAESPAFN
ncbi:MAG: LysR family hydrogen peroxide-inducible transcriptional activator [Paracoccaceae bacterium]|jgi:LysR family hydrogen peroxide-inducible transcriptional activator